MKKQLKISIQIAAIFIVAIFLTFIPEMFREFFGDWYCTGYHLDKSVNSIIKCDYSGSFHDVPTYHWGWRHWLWCFMSITLFITQIIFIFLFDSPNKKTNEQSN